MRCPECFVEEGQLHKEGCAVEECPHCGGQLIAHDHAVERYDGAFVTLTPAPSLLKGRPMRRIPFLYFPRVCMRCGKVNARIFMVSNAEWQKYVPPSIRDLHLCHKCYSEIKELQDAG